MVVGRVGLWWTWRILGTGVLEASYWRVDPSTTSSDAGRVWGAIAGRRPQFPSSWKVSEAGSHVVGLNAWDWRERRKGLDFFANSATSLEKRARRAQGRHRPATDRRPTDRETSWGNKTRSKREGAAELGRDWTSRPGEQSSIDAREFGNKGKKKLSPG